MLWTLLELLIRSRRYISDLLPCVLTLLVTVWTRLTVLACMSWLTFTRMIEE
jgi:hypothetical protein